MAHKVVQLIIGRILTDEALRKRLVAQPTATLTQLRDEGFALTDLEIDALSRIDPAWWSRTAKGIDSHLQQCDLNADG
jgi:hypothetical protein